LTSSNNEEQDNAPKNKGKVCADEEVEMEIAQDEQMFEEEDRACSSHDNEGRIFDSIPEQLFLRPCPSYPNPTNATSSSHPVRPRRFTPTFLRGHPHAPIPYEDFA
jgi:hypothetical protein